MDIQGKEVAKVYAFGSSSGSSTYQTILYVDGSTSCDCMGWTRRNPPGGRHCKHTRAVDMGVAERDALSVKDYAAEARGRPYDRNSAMAAAARRGKTKTEPKGRKFDFD